MKAAQPWVFTPANYVSGVPYSARIKAGDKVICLVPDATPEVAGLLTAAPDLLAALRAVLPFVPGYAYGDTAGRSHLIAALDAIAKAEGRA